jgi:hypothetical protein
MLIAWPQAPLLSLITNAWPPEASVYSPSAAQLPAEPHGTDTSSAPPALSRAAMPGTTIARPHEPTGARGRDGRSRGGDRGLFWASESS